MNGDLFWDLFPLVFFNGDYLSSLLINWVGASIVGVILIFVAKGSYTHLKDFVYLATGLTALLVYIFPAVTGGVQYLAVFLSVVFLWLTTAYVLVAVTERRWVSWKEARDFIFPYFFNTAWKEDFKAGFRFRFGLDKPNSQKPKAPRKELTTKEWVKIQLWFVVGTALFWVLIVGFGGKIFGF